MPRSLTWYLSRLKAMSVPEMASRSRGLLRSRWQRAGFGLVNNPPRHMIEPAQRWLATAATPDIIPIETAAISMLGRGGAIFALEPGHNSLPSAWNQDPLTGVIAPLTFGPSIDVHAQSLVGNIKYLWEPNRHIDLVVLAQAFRLTNDLKYLDGIRRRLDSWFEQCPYMRGPNWSSGLELAIRLINWSAIWQLAGGERSELFSGPGGQDFRDRWLRSIYQHVHFVRGHYSGFSSANNHLIGEASGVFIATCTWPFWDRFPTWKQQAFDILVRETELQVAPDGVDREQTLAYEQFVLDFLMLSLLAGRANGIAFPGPYLDRVRDMLRFLASMIDVGGNLPMVGDADDGCVLRLSREPGFCPYRSAIATGALLFEDPGLARKAGTLDDKTRQLVGEEGFERLLGSIEADAPYLPRSHFPDGGYFLLGTDFGQHKEIRLLVDAGPLGYLSIAAHGHADALALYLSVAGREFLVDPGTYTYHGKPEWRAYFRGTRAHNTITVDGQDQSVQAGSFMWLKHAQAKCLQFEKGDEEDIFAGEHDGYRRLEDPVTHRRDIHRRGGVIDVTDTLVCKDDHSIERWWHFSEFCNVAMRDGEVHAENQGVRIRIVPGNGQVCMFRASENPIAGWVSRRFDVKTPSTSVCIKSEIQGTTALHTRIDCYPCRGRS